MSKRNRATGGARRSQFFVDEIEGLEGRRLMAAGAGIARTRIQEIASGGTIELRIIGTNRRDNVRIDDNGSAKAGNVTVTLGDGSTYTSLRPVSLIQFTGKSGRDQVTYNLTGDLVAKRTVAANMGAGRDQFTANLTGAIRTTDYLDLEAFGDEGNDRLTIDQTGESVAGTFFPYLQGDAGNDVLTFKGTGNVGAGASVGPALSGGDGNDKLTADFGGKIVGAYLYSLTLDGGAGNDVIANNVHAAAGSTGKIGASSAQPALVQGGAGDDQVHYAITVDEAATLTGLYAIASGNAGSDNVMRTANVAAGKSNNVDAILGPS